jgi:hypothetical protein
MYTKLNDNNYEIIKKYIIIILEIYKNEFNFFKYNESNRLFNNGIHPCITFENDLKSILYNLYEKDRYFFWKKIK